MTSSQDETVSYTTSAPNTAIIDEIWKDKAKKRGLKQDKYLCFNLGSQECIALGKDSLLF